MNNLSQLMKQAQQMQAKLLEQQKKMAEMEVTGTSGGGMVTVVLNGEGEIKKLNIDPKLMIPDESDIVSDLVIAAYNEARLKIKEKASETMEGLLPPGMKLPF